MKIKLLLIFVVGTLLLFPFVAGSHEEDKLSCDSFTKEKLEDCEYILDSDLSDETKEDLLEILEEDSYSYDKSKLLEFEEIENSKIDLRKLDNSRIILAWNITLFALINYFAFSVLTKSSFSIKWLNAVY